MKKMPVVDDDGSVHSEKSACDRCPIARDSKVIFILTCHVRFLLSSFISLSFWVLTKSTIVAHFVLLTSVLYVHLLVISLKLV